MRFNRKRLAQIALKALGAILLVIGVIGIFLPVLQGLLFIALGLYILSISSQKFKEWLDRQLAPWPRVKGHIDRQHDRVMKFIARFKRPQ